MKYTTIPQTDIKVSKICLGTMTYGQQNTEAEAHEQLNYAKDQGRQFYRYRRDVFHPGQERKPKGVQNAYIGTWLKGSK